MVEIRFESGIFGEKYWKSSEFLVEGRSYKQWYFDSYERGVWNVYSSYNMGPHRPYYLYQHDSYDLYRGLHRSNMDCWERYFKVGWHVDDLAAVDGNCKLGDEVPVRLPIGGFKCALGHGDYQLYFKKNESFWAFERARNLEIGPTVKNTEVLNLSCKSVVLEGDFSNGCDVGDWEKDFVTHVNGSGVLSMGYFSNLSISRGIVAGDFVFSCVNSEGKLYQMVSLTPLKRVGDLVAEERIRLNAERPDLCGINSFLEDPMLHSFKHIGHDTAVGLRKDDRIGVFEIDEWLRIIRPLTILHWVGEWGMALAGGFVVFVAVNSYYFFVYKLYHFIKLEGEWDESVRYWCYWDHRMWDVKSLEWSFREHLREVLWVDSSSYLGKHLWAFEHCLNGGYGVWGLRLRMYEWLDMFGGGVIW